MFRQLWNPQNPCWDDFKPDLRKSKVCASTFSEEAMLVAKLVRHLWRSINRGRTKRRSREEVVPLCLLPGYSWKDRTLRANVQGNNNMSIQYKKEVLLVLAELPFLWPFLHMYFRSSCILKGVSLMKDSLEISPWMQLSIHDAVSVVCCSEFILLLRGFA